MDAESTLYKTAELVRDAVGCYYFICLQCGKDFENLEDTVLHIEKYFYEPSDDNSGDASLMTPMTINEPDWMANENDIDSTVLANIKKESFEEYEDYKLSIPHESQGDAGTTRQRAPIHCPLCSKTLNRWESSLESHLMRVHHRSRSFAKIYECNVCGRNTFTRPYDLERHQLTHGRYVNGSADDESTADESYQRSGDRNQNSVLRNILSQSDSAFITEAVENRTRDSPNVTSSTPPVKIRTPNKRYISIDEPNVERLLKKPKPMEPNVIDKLASRTNIPSKPSNYCSICRSSFSKKDTLESHLIRVHHRNKQYAKVYECNLCGKNTFTRPYDLRRHQLTHLTKGHKVQKVPLPKKVFKAEPKTDDKKTINQVPLMKTPSTIKPVTTSSVTEVKKITGEIRTTDPEKDGILCAICSKKFDSYLDVTLHLKFVHNQKRTYKCSYPNCTSDSFTNAFLLHRHEMSHSVHYGNVAVGSNQNRTKCVFCRRSFNKKWNLMKHEKRNLTEMSTNK